MSSSTRSQKASIEQISLSEKLNIIPNLIIAYSSAFAAIFTGVFVGKENRPPQYYKYVMYVAIQSLVSRMTVRQFHAISPPTDEAYETLCKNKGMTPNSEVLEDGTRAHWIGSSSASKVIINFHGGGYVLPAGFNYLEFMYHLQQFIAKQDKDIAILFLSYDLAPVARYPRQLQQASMLLDHVLNHLHKDPSNIILTGDSAGGNLALSLISHIMHPHPSKDMPIPQIKLSKPLRGVVLTSPWLDFDTTKDSFKRNATKDCITIAAGNRWSSAFMGTPAPHHSNKDNYNQAIVAPESWWEDFPAQEVLIVAGKDEVLVDGIVEFAERLQKALGDRVTFFNADGEAHDQTNIDMQMGYKEVGPKGTLIKDWIASKL